MHWRRGGPTTADKLPSDVAQGVFEVYYVQPERCAVFLADAKATVVDLTGDGEPEYVVETYSENARGKEGDRDCWNEVLEKSGSAYREAYRFDCCEYVAAGGKKGKGGSLQCKSPDAWTVRYKGAWPKDFDRSTTLSEVTQAYQQGIALLKQGKYKEAKSVICEKLNLMKGAPVRDCEDACATAALNAGDLDQAHSAADAGRQAYPKFDGFRLTLARVAELRGDLRGALVEYEKFLELGGRASSVGKVVEGKVAELKKQFGTK